MTTPNEPKRLSLTEYGKLHNLNDDELVEFGKRQFGWDEEEIRLMISIERGEGGDRIELPPDANVEE